jgi:hypothetical protein
VRFRSIQQKYSLFENERRNEWRKREQRGENREQGKKKIVIEDF